VSIRPPACQIFEISQRV